jgi:hypothetical protein
MRLPAFPQLLFDTRRRRTYTFLWVASSLILLALNYIAGPAIQVSALFVIPVILAVWGTGRWAGVFLAVALPLLRLYILSLLEPRWTFTESMINAGIRVFVLMLVVIFVDAVRQSLALTREVRILRAFLPICSFCKRIKDERNAWHSIERYLSEGTTPEFKPSICPDCHTRHYGQTFDRR